MKLFKGIVIPADRGKAKHCSICNNGFGVLNTEHQCKRCKRPVCDKCSPNKAIALKYDKGTQKPHR